MTWFKRASGGRVVNSTGVNDGIADVIAKFPERFDADGNTLPSPKDPGAIVVPKWEWELIYDTIPRQKAEIAQLKKALGDANSENDALRLRLSREQPPTAPAPDQVAEDVRAAVKTFVDECRALFTPWDDGPRSR